MEHFYIWDCANYERTKEFKKVLNDNNIEYWEHAKYTQLLLNMNNTDLYLYELKEQLEEIEQQLEQEHKQELHNKKVELLESIDEVEDFIIEHVYI